MQKPIFSTVGPLALGLALLVPGCSSEVPGQTSEERPVYEPAADPWINPPFLSEPFPTENPELAEADATIIRRIDGNPTSLNPIFNLPWQDHYMHGLLFVNPFHRHASMEFEPNVADGVVLSWEESDDHKTFTVELNPALRWHDGEPWTAHDIEFSYRVIDTDSVPALFYKRKTERLESVRALGDHTVEYVHKDAVATRFMDMNFPIIPEHIWGNPGERLKEPSLRSGEYFSHYAFDEVVGSGPYKLVEYRTNDQVVVERWDDYPLKRPQFKRQILKVLPDTNIALLMMKNGELDEMTLTGQQLATQTNDEDFRRHAVKVYGPRRMVGGLAWNADGSNPFFGDARVRRAMSYAFDRDRFLRVALFNVYPPSTGIFEESHWAHNPNIVRIDYDLDEAARLLDEADWRVDDDDGWRYKEIEGERVRFSFELMHTPGVPSFNKMVDILGRDLQRLGVELTAGPIESAALNARLREHDFQAYISVIEVSSDPDEWDIYWSTKYYDTGYNFIGYSNPLVDELFIQARYELDREKRVPLYQEIQKILYDDQPHTWIWDYRLMWAFNNRMRGVGKSVSGPILFYPGTQTWWKAKEPGLVDVEGRPVEATSGM